GDRLFRPSGSLTVPDLQNNTKDRGMFVVPPTYAELGGLKSANSTGIYGNNAKIRMPGSTEHKVPHISEGNTQ
ncbi:MAG TPA: hypothetical protein VNB49_04185, partial [Candidatus Dormibacteraeota bacterium]|nr:hypothetical protein [Candidatus Dormibacteraeota bacterium]